MHIHIESISQKGGTNNGKYRARIVGNRDLSRSVLHWKVLIGRLFRHVQGMLQSVRQSGVVLDYRWGLFLGVGVFFLILMSAYTLIGSPLLTPTPSDAVPRYHEISEIVAVAASRG